MEKVTIDEIAGSETGEADVRNVADALGTTDLAMNRRSEERRVGKECRL